MYSAPVDAIVTVAPEATAPAPGVNVGVPAPLQVPPAVAPLES